MREAADAGKHILCEKPIALTLEDTREAIDVVAARGVLLAIGFNRRYDPAYVAAKRALDAGDIGDPWIVKLVGRDPRPARSRIWQEAAGCSRIRRSTSSIWPAG